MMRQLKITRDTAVKARTTAMHTLQQIVVHAPPALREALHDLTDHGLLTRCAGLRPGPIDTPTAAAKYTPPGGIVKVNRLEPGRKALITSGDAQSLSLFQQFA